MPTLNYSKIRDLLEGAFLEAETALLEKNRPDSDPHFTRQCEAVFFSRTQAYREVLLGCTLARIEDPSIDIRSPYVDQGSNAFSGRSLDENVVNPFLQRNRIPCSKGPYLSVFRRSVRFDRSTRSGLRDKAAYDSFLEALEFIEAASDDRMLDTLRFELYKFAQLREDTDIPLARVKRISLDQYERLISGLLASPSGGLFPVLLVVATFRAIEAFFDAGWEITWQGINVSDASAGASGDITISTSDGVILAIEVTERHVDKSRVVATFNSKIAVSNLSEYLFILGRGGYSPEAKEQAQRYFAQGHEVNFVAVKDWILMVLTTIGSRGRTIFNDELTCLLDAQGLPRGLRVAWNNQLSDLLI